MTSCRRLVRFMYLAMMIGSAFPAGSATTARGEGVNKIETTSLKGCTIQVAEGQPAYVRRVIEDLGRVIKAFSGVEPVVREVGRQDQVDLDGPVVAVGLSSAAEFIKGAHWKSSPPPGEAFLIIGEWKEGPGGKRVPVVSVAGTDAGGVKFAVVELIRRLRVSPGDVRIELPLLVERYPRFTTRGMYAHLHWWYNHPYALRSWTLDDWKRYVDLLTHLGFNPIQMWPMMELIPHPMSPEDEAYLRKYAAVVDYVHEQRGMKAFIGSCPNNITEDARGVPIEKREYFDFEKRLDPGAPANLERILEYRSDLYRTVPHADGYWVIDSDPGGWKGSPASAFVDILVGHRGLIDKFCREPGRQPLIYWMWMGWGAGKLDQNLRDTLAGMVERINGPWLIHVCWPEHVQACEALKLQDRAIYFPYNMVEDEPSGPLTDIRLKRIQEAVEYAADHKLKAIQGNAQTPIVQLPNIAALALAAWGDEVADEASGPLQHLADRLLSREADVLAEGWRSLGREDARESLRLGDRLRELARDESARGTLSAIIGDWQPRILNDLASMLIIHARAVAFATQAGAGTADAVVVEALTSYLQAAAAWLERTGFHNNRIIVHKAYRDPVADALARMKEKLGEEALMQRIVTPAVSAAGQRCNAQFVEYVAQTVLGKRG